MAVEGIFGMEMTGSYDMRIKFTEDVYCVVCDVLNIACLNIDMSEKCSNRIYIEKSEEHFMGIASIFPYVVRFSKLVFGTS
jgi:hypothetical protein